MRTLIWGSCVSRDTFEYLPDDYDLVAYIARQSWISAGCPAVGVDFGQLQSPFQQRITQSDVDGDAFDALQDRANGLDLVLLDLCDERLGVVDLGKCGVATRSIEKIGNGSQARIDRAGSVLVFGSEAHLDRWREAARGVQGRLCRLGLSDKVLVLAPEWAVVDDLGTPAPLSFGKHALEMNRTFERYYEELETLGFTLLRAQGTLAGSSHPWGPAPFHFHDVTYQDLTSAIRSFAHV